MENKKDIMLLNHKLRLELEKEKLNFFQKRQTLMRENLNLLWKLKNDYHDKVHTHQMDKIKFIKNAVQK